MNNLTKNSLSEIFEFQKYICEETGNSIHAEKIESLKKEIEDLNNRYEDAKKNFSRGFYTEDQFDVITKTHERQLKELKRKMKTLTTESVEDTKYFLEEDMDVKQQIEDLKDENRRLNMKMVGHTITLIASLAGIAFVLKSMASNPEVESLKREVKELEEKIKDIQDECRQNEISPKVASAKIAMIEKRIERIQAKIEKIKKKPVK